MTTLREAMRSREGTIEADHQIARGRHAYAVVRSSSWRHPETAIVFGTCLSDALRRASAPARLGEEIDDDETVARRIRSGWDEPIVWPFEAVTA